MLRVHSAISTTTAENLSTAVCRSTTLIAHAFQVLNSRRYEAGGFTADFSANYYLDVEFCRTSDTCGAKSLYGDYATNQVPPKYSVDLTLSQKMLEDRLTLGGRVSYVGPRAIGHGDVTAVGAGEFISLTRWKPYTLIDVFAEYKINDSLTATARIENLTDQYYVDPLGLVNQPGPGRTFYAGLTSNFGGDQRLPQLAILPVTGWGTGNRLDWLLRWCSCRYDFRAHLGQYDCA